MAESITCGLRGRCVQCGHVFGDHEEIVHEARGRVCRLCDPCECSEDYGPCEAHSEVLAQREGGNLRTSEELCAVFIGDVMAILASESGLAPELLPGESARDVAADYWRECPNGGWAPFDSREAYSLGEALSDAAMSAESLLPADVSAWWEDGYVIARITGGPLAD